MSQYNANLNTDAGNIHTPARYDGDTDKWIMDVSGEELLSMKASLEDLVTKLSNTLTVQDADAKSELEAMKAKLEEIEIKLNEQTYEDGAALTKLTGSKVKVEEITLFDAVSVLPGGSASEILNTDGASEIWVGVRIDQQPWDLLGAGFTPWRNDTGLSYDLFYPERNNFETTAEDDFYVTSLALNMRRQSPMGTNSFSLDSLADAKLFTGWYPDNIRVRVRSKHQEGNATLTVKVIKVWR